MSEELIEISKDSERGFLSAIKKILFKIKVWFSVIQVEGKSKYGLINVFNFFFLSVSGIKLVGKFFFAIIESVTGKAYLKKESLDYNLWVKSKQPNNHLLKQQKAVDFPFQPFFSIGILVRNNDLEVLKKTTKSVIKQSYDKWELLLFSEESLIDILKDTYKNQSNPDKRIKIIVLKKEFAISEQLEKISGDFFSFINPGDQIALNCFFCFTKTINKNTSSDFIYSDEDQIDETGIHQNPYFKPNWSPDNLLSRNYIGGLAFIRTNLAKKCGEFINEYDLLLKVSEKTSNEILHVRKLLYHKLLKKQEETKERDKSIVEAALLRRNEPGEVDFSSPCKNVFDIKYQLENDAMISIIIPTKNRQDLVRQCVDSIFGLSTYKNFEVIIIDNGSDAPEFFEMTKQYSERFPDKFLCIRHDILFNFSALINYGASHSKGDYLLLLNNDTKVITPDWMERMLGQAQRKSIGVVGVKLLYPNNTIQHAGVIIKEKGASHIFVQEARYSEVYHNYINTTNNYSALTAACIMIKKRIFVEVGGFDEEFKVDFNDIDFCLRVKELGLNNVYVPSVELFHYESISRGNPYATKVSYEGHLREVNMFRSRWVKYLEDPFYYNPLS